MTRPAPARLDRAATMTARQQEDRARRQHLPLTASCAHTDEQGRGCPVTIAPRFTGRDLCRYHGPRAPRRQHHDEEAAA